MIKTRIPFRSFLRRGVNSTDSHRVCSLAIGESLKGIKDKYDLQP